MERVRSKTVGEMAFEPIGAARRAGKGNFFGRKFKNCEFWPLDGARNFAIRQFMVN